MASKPPLPLEVWMKNPEPRPRLAPVSRLPLVVRQP